MSHTTPDPADCEPPESASTTFLGHKKKNYSLDPTFEQYFTDPFVQKSFYVNILSVQLFTSFLCFLVTFACTIISNQHRFLNNLDNAFGPIVVNIFILLLVGGTFTLLCSRYPSFNHPTWFLHKTLIETLLRMYQAGLVTFATTFGFEKLYRMQDEGSGAVLIVDGAEIELGSPTYFCVAFIYGLNLSLYLSLTIWLRYKTNATIDALTVHVFSLTRISVCLLVAVPSIFIVRSRNPTWDILQMFLGSLWAILDGLILVYTLKLGTTKGKSKGAGPAAATAEVVV